MNTYASLLPGDPAPWFQQKCTSNENYTFNTVGGRYVLMGFHMSASDAHGQAMLALIQRERARFDDERLCFFGVSIDAGDAIERRVAESLPGIRYFWDLDGRISREYGALPREAALGGEVAVRRFWLLLDPALRVMARVNARTDGGELAQIVALLDSLPPLDRYLGFPVQAPVLFIPDVFEPAFCQTLVTYYERQGGQDSGFMRDVNGKTVGILDYSHKRRSDCHVDDDELRRAIRLRLNRRVMPEIHKVHCFNATHIERQIIGCYDSATSDHFRPHRDNTSRGTAHRRFAVSINLNADFDGGELSFPEYGPRSYKARPGMAIVFSCALLHAVSPVTRGKRYAFLPFLYDAEAAALREANNVYLSDEVVKYQRPGAL